MESTNFKLEFNDDTVTVPIIKSEEGTVSSDGIKREIFKACECTGDCFDCLNATEHATREGSVKREDSPLNEIAAVKVEIKAEIKEEIKVEIKVEPNDSLSPISKETPIERNVDEQVPAVISSSSVTLRRSTRATRAKVNYVVDANVIEEIDEESDWEEEESDDSEEDMLDGEENVLESVANRPGTSLTVIPQQSIDLPVAANVRKSKRNAPQSGSAPKTKPRHSKSQERPHECADCGEAFKVKQALRTHYLLHTGERPFKCTQCPATFTQLGHCNQHRRSVHGGKRPFKCDYCPKSFTQNQHRLTHQVVHQPDRTKAFKCTIAGCGKAYKYKSALDDHNKLHSGLAPFKCDECGKVYTHIGPLRIHRRVHTLEKPFRCGECGKAFQTKRNLKVHSYKHTGELPYKCQVCDQTFTTLVAAREHEKIVHTVRAHTRKLK